MDNYNQMLPIGFGMALAMNEPAMRRFETLEEKEKRMILERAGKIDSKSEMQRMVNELLL